MKVREMMCTSVESCTPDTDLASAAMIMWRNDCGIVPVVAPETRKLEGVVTDRDICMAVATTGRRPNDRSVGEVMARELATIESDDDVQQALDIMEREHVRRLPVVDDAGNLAGMLSINDLVLATGRGRGRARAPLLAEDVMVSLRGICAHRAPAVESETQAHVAVPL